MFDIIFRPFCWIKKIYDIFRSFGAHATGHTYIEEKDSGVIAKVKILKCEVCSKINISWERIYDR